MRTQPILALLALTAAGVSASVLAADTPPTNFYGVVSIGRSKIDADPAAVDQHNLRGGFTTSVSSSSSGATGGKFQLGYTLGKTFALEGGYTYLGQANFTSITNLGTIGGSKEAWLYNLDLVGKLPVNMQFSVLARFGAYYWKTRNEMPNAGTKGTATVNDNAYDFKAGVGVQYDFTERFAVRGEFERYNGIGKNETTGDSRVNQLTVGAVLKF